MTRSRVLPPLRVLLVAAAMSLGCSACVMGPQGSGGGGAGGASDGGGGSGHTGCDARNTCEDCAVCASETTCAQALAICQDNPACVGLDECMYYCQGDVDCDEMCRLQNAVGIEDWDRAASCIYCDACSEACAGSRFCG